MGHPAALIDPEIKEQIKQSLGYSRMSEKTARIVLLISQGIAIEKAYYIVMNKPLTCNVTKTELKQKSEKWLLNSPEMQKLSHNAAKSILQGKPIIGKVKYNGEEHINVIKPKGSDVTAMIDMVTKRTEPIKDHGSQGGVNLFIDKLQVNNFQAQDVVSQELLDNGSNDKCIEIKDLDE